MRPANAVGQPDLVIYWDGSDEAMCAATYIVWPTSSGVSTNLLCAKTRVGPLNRISTPRAEIQAAVISVRLRSAIMKHTKIDYNAVYHIRDSECTLAMMKKDSVALKEFMGNQVTECLEGSNESEWYHTPTHLNISDLGTRRLARVEDLDSQLTWSRGPSYLRLPKDQWDIRRNINSKNIP